MIFCSVSFSQSKKNWEWKQNIFAERNEKNAVITVYLYQTHHCVLIYPVNYITTVERAYSTCKAKRDSGKKSVINEQETSENGWSGNGLFLIRPCSRCSGITAKICNLFVILFKLLICITRVSFSDIKELLGKFIKMFAILTG